MGRVQTQVISSIGFFFFLLLPDDLYILLEKRDKLPLARLLLFFDILFDIFLLRVVYETRWNSWPSPAGRRKRERERTEVICEVKLHKVPDVTSAMEAESLRRIQLPITSIKTLIRTWATTEKQTETKKTRGNRLVSPVFFFLLSTVPPDTEDSGFFQLYSQKLSQFILDCIVRLLISRQKSLDLTMA